MLSAFSNVQLGNLLHWEALAYGDRSIVDEKQRTSYNRQKTDAFAQAQSEGTLSQELDLDHLLFLTLHLVGRDDHHAHIRVLIPRPRI